MPCTKTPWYFTTSNINHLVTGLRQWVNKDTSIPPPWNEDTSVYSGTPLFHPHEMRTPLYTVELLYSTPMKWGHLCIQWWNSSIPTPWNEDTSVYSGGTPLFQPHEMRTPLYTVELLYSNPMKWGHLCIQWNSSIPTPWNEDTSVYSGTPLFQPHEMRTPLYTVELLYSTPMKWGHLCIQWNSFIPPPWNEDTSVYSGGTPLFQPHEMRTPLYTVVELLYSNPMKWGHLCIQWNSSIPTPWNEDTSVYSGTPLFHPMKWGHLCIQWNSSIPTPWNEDTSVYSGTPLFQPHEMRTPLYTVELLYSNPMKWGHLCIQWNSSIPTLLKWGHLCIQWNSSIPTPWNEDTSVYSGTPLFQPHEMRTPLYTVELLYSNPMKWGHFCIQWNSSIPTPWNEDTSVYSGTPLFQPHEMRTPLYTVELLYSNPMKWGHLCIQWNSSIPTPWNEDTSVYSGTPLFQHPEMRTPLYTVELLYSNTLKWGHLCIQWNSSIPAPWNEDTSVYSGTPLFQHPEMRTPLYTVELLYSNTLKWGHLSNQDTLICPKVSGIERSPHYMNQNHKNIFWLNFVWWKIIKNSGFGGSF